ncbi:hypothetical protein BUALT_Bualt11G0048600 [Buddleja alternifolia]|uniref:Filament-like plant protein 3 n=1 Tax=Buddleja alternifolia TaxID=168488 RepID=A0AAV6WXF8_9LAMI|nr:hypothetical protein BUALT_Bualt11G0048600 [Buddleja alternifolia]
MDRRSWLWRRKSSEKSPSGETESSGSLSSHSERFSDDQTLLNHNNQSPEVTSKAAPSEELNDPSKTLSEKLSEALLNIRAKEDLVKQHAKVAEEAVSGWERAENEVLVLKKQIDALTQKNSILEERVGHLDGALKECLRQLRQSREEQEQKIYDAVTKKTSELESKNSELESQLVELHNQIQNAKTDANNTMLGDALSKLEAAENENSILKLKLLSKTEELELRINERDLSTHAAETASKQYIDSVKKVAKLEAECRRLKAIARKATLTENDRQSIENDSCKTSEFESIESAMVTGVGQFKYERNLGRSPIGPSVEIDLMDDFLEMERIAALPEIHNRSNPFTRVDETETMINQIAQLEENLKKITEEKVNLEIALKECQIQLRTSEDQLKQTETELVKLNTQLALADEVKRTAQKEVEYTKLQLKNTTKILDEAEVNMVQIQDQLTNANEAKSRVEVELKDANVKKAEAESRLKFMELELETLHSRTRTLEKEVEKERNFSRESESQLKIMEETLHSSVHTLEKEVVKERNFSREAESRLKIMELELETLYSSIRVLEKEVDKERNFSREAVAKCEILETEISRTKSDSQSQRSTIIEEFRMNQDKELAVAANKFAECQKTIASLGRQLKSLATFEDFLMDSERPVAVL